MLLFLHVPKVTISKKELNLRIEDCYWHLWNADLSFGIIHEIINFALEWLYWGFILELE
jgi:hypothetical protein